MRKNIDSIYRDRFEGAKLPPPADSWENILSQMPRKEEKRLFPLWFTLAGVAAVLAIIFTAYLQYPQPAAKENYVIGPFPNEKGDFNTSEVSVKFNELMRESDILLQALILQGREIHSGNEKVGIAAGREEISEVNENQSSGSSSWVQVQNTKTGKYGENPVEGKTVEVMEPEEELSEAVLLVSKEAPIVEISKKEEFKEKFKVSTKVAPVKGYALNTNFSPKEASGEVTFSYGVNVAYAISKKVNLRSGLNKVDLEYNTHEISFNDVASAAASFSENMMESTTLASPSNGTLNQKMGFFEIPLEVEYVLVDRKIAIGIIGGGSVLFLEENELLLDIPGNRANFEETNSMNYLSYTTNLGLSLGYNLSRQLQFNLEPVVKFQMNTFRDNNGQNPYFFGLYSGFSYRF
ncbi:hypothetical protein [Salinimicrobium terrae]|uniref:hypothetical protein n=1 Tax=Salinimicrobium terrae TaxID=470866 RepID=UPI0003FEE93C|nr:hypothetical protein [Salinimicrobium terrae]